MVKAFARPRRAANRLRACVVAFGCTAAALATAGPALAGYDHLGSWDTSGQTTGLAVNQSTGDVYGANLLGAFPEPGEAVRFTSAGAQQASFATGLTLSGVAGDPLTGNVYVHDAQVLEGGTDPQVLVYAATGGTALDSFSVPHQDGEGTYPQLATDAAGNLYFPSNEDEAVIKFSPDGTELSRIDPGAEDGELSNPSAVAVDSTGDVYVVDGHTFDFVNGRVRKFDSSGALDPSFAVTGNVVSVAVDPTTDEVFVARGAGASYHVERYSPAGVETDDFGAGEFSEPLFPGIQSHLAVDGDTGIVYASDPAGEAIEVFEPLAEPISTTDPATAVGQTAATLNGTADRNGAAGISGCEFEWGTGDQFDQAIACDEIPATDGPNAVSASLTGLSPATTYEYRLVVTTDAGSTTGATQEFTTAAHTCATNPALCPAPPTCATNPALCPPAPPTCATNPALCPAPPAGVVAVAKSASVKRGKATLTVTCKGTSCSAGKLTLKAKVKRGKKKAKTVVIGTAKFGGLAAGEKLKVTVKLSRAAKAALAKSGRLKATVAGDVDGKVTLKGGKKKRKR